jgi:hypothetical protein
MPYRSSLLLLYTFHLELAGKVEIAPRRLLRPLLKSAQQVV